MEQQRFASLMGRARQLLPAEELEPDPTGEPRPAVRKAGFKKVPAPRTSLARLGDVVDYKSIKSAAR